MCQTFCICILCDCTGFLGKKIPEQPSYIRFKYIPDELATVRSFKREKWVIYRRIPTRRKLPFAVRSGSDILTLNSIPIPKFIKGLVKSITLSLA